MNAEKAALELYQPMQADVAIHRPPTKVLEEARQAAHALTDVISKKAKPVKFNGEIYLEFEDWQTVGRFYGITARVRETKYVQYDKVSGFEASADAILVSTGQVISSAESLCLNDESNWAKKPMFQLKSMSQTRACAKALRNVLAWVVVLAGYKPTPAEEMDNVFSQKPSQDAPQGTNSSQPVSQHPQEITDPPTACPKCGAALKYHAEGKWGPWWSCSKYPDCDGKISLKKWQKEHPSNPSYAESEPEPEFPPEPGTNG